MAHYVFEMPLNQSTFLTREFEWNPYDVRGPVTLEAWKYFYGFVTVFADLSYLKQYLVQK
jgi:hypothetical protein